MNISTILKLHPTRNMTNSDPSTNQREGFILIESLIALAIMSILALSAMSIVRTVSQAYRESGAGELSSTTASLIADPQYNQRSGRVRLQSTRTLENGGTWRLYRFRTQAGEERSISIYLPPDNT
jgi:prepilin-type N-terminal cleavage/methylation domain-containing protein